MFKTFIKGFLKIITINNKNFIESEKELSTDFCTGYAKRYKRQVKLFDMQKNMVGVITFKGVFAKATKTDGGWWYSYGDINIIGRLSAMQEYDILQAVSIRKDAIGYCFK